MTESEAILRNRITQLLAELQGAEGEGNEVNAAEKQALAANRQKEVHARRALGIPEGDDEGDD